MGIEYLSGTHWELLDAIEFERSKDTDDHLPPDGKSPEYRDSEEDKRDQHRATWRHFFKSDSASTRWKADQARYQLIMRNLKIFGRRF